MHRLIIDSPEDCKSSQYYYEPQTRCRNCSDLLRMFEGDQDWLRAEVITNINPLDRTTTDSNQDQPESTASIVGNPTITIASSKIKFSNMRDRFNHNDEVLSRLINVESPNHRDYLDESDNNDAHNFDHNQLTTSLDSSLSAINDRTMDEIVTLTKQTQRIIQRFIHSEHIEHDLPDVIEQCRKKQNTNACQMWSNMCVMTMYSHTDRYISSSPSRSSGMYLDSVALNGRQSTRYGWQKCPQFTSTSICDSVRQWHRDEKKAGVELSNIYADEDDPLNKPGTSVNLRLNQPVQLLAYKYSYNGQLLNVDQFGVDDMERFCGFLTDSYRNNDNDPQRQPKDPSMKVGSLGKKSELIKVGHNMRLKCRHDPHILGDMTLRDTMFADLYIGYASNGEMLVKPVPVLVKNLLHNSISVNRKYVNDPSRWKLVHRFFFQAALDDNMTKMNHSNGNDAILLYASEANLDMKFKRQERGLLLVSLLLTINYAQQRLLPNESARISTDSESTLEWNQISVSVTQSLIDMLSYKKDFDLIVTVCSILCGMWALIKCYNIQKCHGPVKLDLNTLVIFIIISCDIISSLFVILTLSFSGYLFVALKFQVLSPQLLAPNEDLENTIVLNLKLALIFKLIGLIYKLYKMLTVDIFFIDWERPKMSISSQYHYSSENGGTGNVKNNNALSTISNDGTTHLNYNQLESSFWRPYTIINRWLKLQTRRRQNLTLQFIAFAFIITYTKLDEIATLDPNIEFNIHSSPRRNFRSSLIDQDVSLSPSPSVAFRNFLLAFVYISLSLIQWIFMRYIYEPFISNSVREFVDLCSVGNVSLFCMLYPRFGYYIHGRNANGSGDCGVAEMNALLEREERDLCTRRGLGQNSDQQTFTIILPKIINDHYRKLRCMIDVNGSVLNSNLMSPMGKQYPLTSPTGKLAMTGNFMRSATRTKSTSRSFSSNRTYIESVVARNKSINTFLTNFLNHIYKDIDYTISERKRFKNFLLDVDLDEETPSNRNIPVGVNNHEKQYGAATFCADFNDSYTGLLWLGIEFDLMLIELLSLLMIDDYLKGPLFISASIIWLIHQGFRSVYMAVARNNLIKKSLIDEKFLMS